MYIYYNLHTALHKWWYKILINNRTKLTKLDKYSTYSYMNIYLLLLNNIYYIYINTYKNLSVASNWSIMTPAPAYNRVQEDEILPAVPEWKDLHFIGRSEEMLTQTIFRQVVKIRSKRSNEGHTRPSPPPPLYTMCQGRWFLAVWGGIHVNCVPPSLCVILTKSNRVPKK